MDSTSTPDLACEINSIPVFIQARLCKIQGLFKDYSVRVVSKEKLELPLWIPNLLQTWPVK